MLWLKDVHYHQEQKKCKIVFFLNDFLLVKETATPQKLEKVIYQDTFRSCTLLSTSIRSIKDQYIIYHSINQIILQLHFALTINFLQQSLKDVDVPKLNQSVLNGFLDQSVAIDIFLTFSLQTGLDSLLNNLLKLINWSVFSQPTYVCG